MEAIVVLLFLLVAAAPVVLAALAVVAYLRSNRIAEILDRLDRIEPRFDRLAAPGLERLERSCLERLDVPRRFVVRIRPRRRRGPRRGRGRP